MIFPDTKGYGPGVKDHDVCNRPDVCSSCLQYRHLKAACRKLTMERMSDQLTLDLRNAHEIRRWL